MAATSSLSSRMLASANVKPSATSRSVWSAGYAVVVRTYSHRQLEQFALAARRLHVINALSDDEHPCQALADFLTLREHWGELRGRTVAYLGDGNNVASSRAQAAAALGVHCHVASPDGYTLTNTVVQRATNAARYGARLRLFTEASDAVAGVNAIYTDTCTSMGREAETSARRRVFTPYQVNDSLMALAKPGALFMHCLPAHRGEKSQRKSSNHRHRWCSIRQKTVCTVRKHCS